MSTPPARRHRIAVATVVGCTLLWSTAGVITRHLDDAGGFDVVFWRSFVCAVVLGALLVARHGRRWLDPITAMGPAGLVCGLAWATMFTCFMLALTMTSVARTLVTMSVAPLLAALLARVVLGERIAPRTAVAIALSAIGIVWMVADGLGDASGGARSAAGMLIAAGVPLAAAVNVVWMKRVQLARAAHEPPLPAIDFSPAVLLGAVLSCVLLLPFTEPARTSAHDLAWLALLGVAQLALPCVLYVRAARHLSAQQAALLSLLEVIFGPIWVWLAVGERPGEATLAGGALVLAALIGDAALRPARPRPTPP